MARKQQVIQQLELDAELVDLAELTPHPDNPRQGDVGAICESIAANGWYGALVVQRSTGRIIVGNHRAVAAAQLGIERVPVVWLDVDDRTALRILLADNRTSDVADYDKAALADLLLGMAGDDPALLDGTGYDADAVEKLLLETGAVDVPEVEEPEHCPTCGQRVRSR